MSQQHGAASFSETRMTRRRLLQVGGACTAALVASTAQSRHAWAAGANEDASERWGFLVDLTRCIGCRSCEIACNKVNGLPQPDTSFSGTGVFNEERRPTEKAFTIVNRYKPSNGTADVYRKVQCMHCNEPACVSACPTAALMKTPEGPVIWDENVCMGCRYCMIACPFNIPAYEYDEAYSPRVRKCTMCYERVFKKGGLPGCVEACPTKAVVFGKRDELIQMARQRLVESPGKYVDHIYGEHEVGGTSWLYLSPVPFEDLGLPELDDNPRGQTTLGFLATLGVVDILGPLALLGLYRFATRREQIAEEERMNGIELPSERGRDDGN